MRKEDKTILIDKIKETLDQYSVVYLANTTSLNAEKTVDLRRAAFKAGIKMMVVKNTLLKKAMDACDIDYSGLYDSLAGPTTLLLSDTGNAPAKLIKEFRGKKETIPAFKLHLSRRPSMLASRTSIPSWPSRARTNSLPMLWHCCSHRQRTSSALSSRVAASSTESWKPYPKKRINQTTKQQHFKSILLWQI